MPPRPRSSSPSSAPKPRSTPSNISRKLPPKLRRPSAVPLPPSANSSPGKPRNTWSSASATSSTASSSRFRNTAALSSFSISSLKAFFPSAPSKKSPAHAVCFARAIVPSSPWENPEAHAAAALAAANPPLRSSGNSAIAFACAPNASTRCAAASNSLSSPWHKLFWSATTSCRFCDFTEYQANSRAPTPAATTASSCSEFRSVLQLHRLGAGVDQAIFRKRTACRLAHRRFQAQLHRFRHALRFLLFHRQPIAKRGFLSRYSVEVAPQTFSITRFHALQLRLNLNILLRLSRQQGLKLFPLLGLVSVDGLLTHSGVLQHFVHRNVRRVKSHQHRRTLHLLR